VRFKGSYKLVKIKFKGSITQFLIFKGSSFFVRKFKGSATFLMIFKGSSFFVRKFKGSVTFFDDIQGIVFFVRKFKGSAPFLMVQGIVLLLSLRKFKGSLQTFNRDQNKVQGIGARGVH
jgi:hypothetical protein